MKEINDIINSFLAAEKAGKKTALATVVHVEGSSYRQPGARMLVTEDGQLTGAISGGCLEGDALRKALLAINQNQNKLVTYDTTDEEDAKLGVQLGCNGIVHILFEPIDACNPDNPLLLLQKVVDSGNPAVLVTIFHLQKTKQAGTSLLCLDNSKHSVLPDTWQQDLEPLVQAALHQKHSVLTSREFDGEHLQAFAEYLPAPVSVVVAGAGNDTIPLVQLGAMLGWRVTVVDGRASHATVQRFPGAYNIVVAPAEKAIPAVPATAETVFLLMTHNYNYDLALLKELVKHEWLYTGILGPRKKLDRMLAALNEAGIALTKQQFERLHGPVGLDIGAETPEEIAISIVAEIKAVLSGRSGAFLKSNEKPIHNRLVNLFPGE